MSCAVVDTVDTTSHPLFNTLRHPFTSTYKTRGRCTTPARKWSPMQSMNGVEVDLPTREQITCALRFFRQRSHGSTTSNLFVRRSALHLIADDKEVVLEGQSSKSLQFLRNNQPNNRDKSGNSEARHRRQSRRRRRQQHRSGPTKKNALHCTRRR